MTPRLLAMTAMGAALAVAGCAPVARAPSAATVALPDRFALLDSATVAAAAPASLLPIDDPAFVALKDRAEDQSPTLEAALARVDGARAGLAAAGAERLPNLNYSGGVSRQRISAAQFGGRGGTGSVTSISPDRTYFNPSLAASWDADIFGQLRANQRAAAARLDAAGADAAAVRLALVTDIATAVADYRTLERRRMIIEQDVTDARSLVSITRVRVNAGVAPGFDLVRAQSLEADALSRLAPFDGERAQILGQLATLTAQPVDMVAASLAAQAPAYQVAQAPALDVPSVLLRRRPDVIAAERRLAAADQDIAAAAAARFPRISISGSLGLVALAFGDLFSTDAVVANLGGSVAGPLLDFGRVGAQIRLSQASGAEAFADYRGAVFTALGEVEASIGAIKATDQQVTALEAQARIDADAVALARIRYRNGLDNFLTVIEAQRTANASRSAAESARGDAQRLRIALYRAIGGE